MSQCRWKALSGAVSVIQHHTLYRDIKPANIFVTKRGILDFGLAKMNSQKNDDAGIAATATEIGECI